MKKIFTLFALFCFVFLLVSCTNTTTSKEATTATKGEETSSTASENTTTKEDVTTTEKETTTEEEITTTVDNSFVNVKEYDLLDYNSEYTLTTDKLKGYYFGTDFHAGNDTILYVDFDEFLKAMDGYLVYDEYKFEKTDTTYTVYWTYVDEETEESEDYHLKFDLENETVEMDLYFGYNTNDMEETDYGYALSINEEKCYENEDYTATYSLKKYNIDLNNF